MDLQMFGSGKSGALVPIAGTDPRHGEWEHRAFVPNPLPRELPDLDARTHLQIANARAAVAALDSTSAQLDNPQLLRSLTLRKEAQSTSALEGTYAPLGEVLTADDQDPEDINIREILNYVTMANHAFAWVEEGRPLSIGLLCDLQKILVSGTQHEGPQTGDLRSIQVVIGRRPETRGGATPVYGARFIPPPPGNDLRSRLGDLLDWMNSDFTGVLDPVAASGMAHYQFECLHPFHDGNGRLGRLLIPVHLVRSHVLREPTLTVSPWFEARRAEYYDHLFAVSAESAWDAWLNFFAAGIEESAVETRTQMLNLVGVQRELQEIVRASPLRAGTASVLVDYAVSHPSFTVRNVERDLDLSYGRANKLVEQLVQLEILAPLRRGAHGRRFYAPQVLDVLVGRG